MITDLIRLYVSNRHGRYISSWKMIFCAHPNKWWLFSSTIFWCRLQCHFGCWIVRCEHHCSADSLACMVVVLAEASLHSDCLFDSCYLGCEQKESKPTRQFNLNNSAQLIQNVVQFPFYKIYLFELKLILSTNVFASFKLFKLVVGWLSAYWTTCTVCPVHCGRWTLKNQYQFCKMLLITLKYPKMLNISLHFVRRNSKKIE